MFSFFDLHSISCFGGIWERRTGSFLWSCHCISCIGLSSPWWYVDMTYEKFATLGCIMYPRMLVLGASLWCKKLWEIVGSLQLSSGVVPQPYVWVWSTLSRGHHSGSRHFPLVVRLEEYKWAIVASGHLVWHRITPKRWVAHAGVWYSRYIVVSMCLGE